MAFANRQYLSSRQLRLSMSLSTWSELSPFDYHIHRILCGRSGEEVFGADAGSDVAFVQDVEAVQNRAVRQLPRYLRRSPFTTASATFANMTITIFATSRGPDPAAEAGDLRMGRHGLRRRHRSVAVDFGPEPFRKRFALSGVCFGHRRSGAGQARAVRAAPGVSMDPL